MIAKTILLISYVLYFYGMYSDIQTRKFKNNTLLPILALGVLFSIVTLGWQSIYSFLIFAFATYVALKLYEKNIIGAADLKVLTSAFLFINCCDSKSVFVFSISLVLCVLSFTLFYLFKMHGLKFSNWKNHIKMEKYYLTELIYTKQFSDKIDATKESFDKSVPYTIPICCSIIITTFIINFL